MDLSTSIENRIASIIQQTNSLRSHVFTDDEALEVLSSLQDIDDMVDDLLIALDQG